MPSIDTDRAIRYAIAIVAALTLLYSLLITQQVLAWFGILIPLLLLYLVWRFVRAHERVADALEVNAGTGDSPDARGDAGIDARERESDEDEDDHAR
ncbi:MAG: glycerol ABC transporter substrate-binding protein [Haloferacaceae archaeon]